MYQKCNVHDAFLSGERCHRGNVFTDRDTIYSYGDHFPMGKRMDDGSLVINESKYSVTTSKHQGQLRRHLEKSGYEPTDETGEFRGYRHGNYLGPRELGFRTRIWRKS